MIGLAQALIGAKGATDAATEAKTIGNQIKGVQKAQTRKAKTDQKREDYAKKLFKNGGMKKPTAQNIKDKEHLRKYDRKLLRRMGLTEDEIDWD